MKESALVSYDTLRKMNSNSENPGNGVVWVTLPYEQIPIRVSSDLNHPASLPPVTVMESFTNVVNQIPDKLALSVKRNGVWRNWTYSQYSRDTMSFARSLVRFDVDMYQSVAIIGFNSPEWVIANMGTIFAGCIPAGIYTTNGPDACHYIAAHSGAAIIVVEDEGQCQKILSIRDRLPSLKAIVQWGGTPPKDIQGVYSWDQFLGMGIETPEAAIRSRMNIVGPGNCCTLIYTSGTTGNPKAVMISHDNITWTARVAAKELFETIDLTKDERIVSYLPLSHIAAQLIDIHASFTIGASVFFADPDALKGSLVNTLQEVRPTKFLAVPRVWEKIEEKMRAIGASNTGIKKTIGDWAKSVGFEGTKAKAKGDPMPWGWNLANRIVYSNIKKNLGLDKCDLHATAAAPISMKTLDYFSSLDIPILEVYGMSESTGPHTVSLPAMYKHGTVGKPLFGVEMKLDGMDDKGHGEICMRGRHVFMGYLHNPEATMNTIDKDGWLHSGDIGCYDEDGFVKITGRIKELIITAGGENVPPILIEDVIKEEIPAISNVMVIGDKRKYLSCLLTFRSEPDANGLPTDTPGPATMDLISYAKSSAKTIQEVSNCPKIRERIDEGIYRCNKRAVSRAQHIRKWTSLANDFTLDGGELTPTMKLKRKVVMEKYKDLVEAMYTEAEIVSRL